ncbi:hypothetical protein K4F52_010392, partial [Lecanicillium sp. MT-2017a]
MFLPQLHEPFKAHGNHPSSFFIARSLYLSLFHPLDVELVPLSPPRKESLDIQCDATTNAAPQNFGDPTVPASLRDEVMKLTAELEKTRAELEKTKAELEKTKAELDRTKAELSHRRLTPTGTPAMEVELDELKNELDSIKKQRLGDMETHSETQAQLQRTIVELAATNAALAEAQRQLAISSQEENWALTLFDRDKHIIGNDENDDTMLLDVVDGPATDSGDAMDVDDYERDSDERSESLTDFLNMQAPQNQGVGVELQETTWEKTMVKMMDSDGNPLCEGHEE